MYCSKPIKVGRDFVPCGKCPACLANKRAELVFRLRCEFSACKFGLFVTLTYDNEHLPLEGVNKRDVQLFLKRFRKGLKSRSFRYFIISEYGDHTFRPHYHGLFFFSEDFTRDKVETLIVNSWQNGFCKFGDIEEGSIVYCTKYCLKGSTTPRGMNETFRLASNRPGIGYSYLEKFGRNYVKKQDFSVVHLFGISSRMPRYFREKLKSPEQFLTISSFIKRFDLDAAREERARQMYYIKFAAFRRRYGNDKTEEDFNKFLNEARERKSELVIKHTKKQKM